MIRLKTTLTAAAVAAGLLAGTGSAAADPVEAESAQRGGLSRYYDQRLDWAACGHEQLDAAGAQCANVTVPLDYQRPRGRTITVAVSRLKAADPARRRGIMLSNPGGPGGAGLDMMLRVQGWMSPDVRARYDLIGMDPRGIGRSSPVDCKWSVGPMLRSAGVDRAGFDRVVALESDLAKRCAEREGDRLPHITTRNTARDMDVVRGAMGEQRVSYFGWSYGTYLGAVYTQMFPQRTDRFVLDSAVDPRKYGLGMFQDLGAPNEAALDLWAEWTARHDAEYHLGTTAKQVRAGVEELIRRSARTPIRVGDYTVDDNFVPIALFGPLSDPRAYPLLAGQVRELTDAADGKGAPPSPELEQALRFMFGPGAHQDGDGQAAVLCGDVRYQRDPESYWRDIQRSRATQPVFGAFANNITACAFWAQPKERPTVVHNNRPALIVQATGDTRTAYQHGVALHKAMTGSRLVTLKDVPVHAVFGNYPNTCTENVVNTYFADGTLPARDLTCQDDAR
ncbi:pimeloyl-ACP methyl ester carboxylesterase [Saccharothrix tamanrassetensis]|uniref:Pimeloyl-ACP methyl ester carboxylesterase n=1 Tax=Saccharothrix tamanrassetensis TaxID=1051531 RepID=A0A841CKV4_9PSEU|nr:alpha/beta fold hydrolase [Saccharothrix tamanrassetensis]MBB5956236.1 pimeloyl-ACP methyl ester carboxylesterase [Saccharothrix tamanrassetensis]